MDTNKKTSWLDRLIERHGEKLFLERVKNNPKYYRLSHDNHNEVNNLIEATKRKNINIIKGYNIPIKYEGKYANDYRADNDKLSEKENKFKLGVTYDDENIQPKITLLRPAASAPRIAMLETIGHELGHAKDRLKLKSKMQKIENLRNRGNNKKANKKYTQLSKWYNKRDYEAIADKNIPKYLKQMGVPKKDRQASYYMRRKYFQDNRYSGKHGNLKYLKDYIFGFSLLPEGYNLYKPMTQEWKDLMREHFYNIYFSVGEYIASIEDFKNREKERTGKTLNDTDWSLRTNLEWRKYLYGDGKSSKWHQDLEYTSKYRDNPEIMNIYMAGKHEGIAEAIKMLQNNGIFSDDDSYISHD